MINNIGGKESLMRFPWVSRATLDDIVAIYKGWLDHAREENVRSGRAYMDLLGKYHQLQLSGATAAVSDNVPRATLAPLEPDPVLLAVNARAGTDSRKRAMMLAQVRRDRADHKSDIEIVQAIESGVPTDGLPA